MKKYINKLLVICTLLFLIVSCESDALLTTLQEVSFKGAISASSNAIVITPKNLTESVLVISWSEAKYPVQAPVNYTLQFDVPSDTIGSTAWAKSVRIVAGEDVLSNSILGDDLNKLAIKLGLKTDVSGTIVVRIESNLDRTAYSKAIAFTVTPYVKPVVFGQIYMPGGYQDFNIATAGSLDAIDSGVYQGYVTYSASAYLGFKLNTSRNWDQFYGAGSANNILVDHSDTDFAMPGAGSYQINVNLNTNRWIATPYSWGIVGDGTAGSWDNSTPMSYDHQLKVWKFTGLLKVGNVKFRLNNSWTINYGPKNNTDDKVYLDDPGAYYIGEAGNFEIIFKVNDTDPANNGYPVSASYTVTRL